MADRWRCMRKKVKLRKHLANDDYHTLGLARRSPLLEAPERDRRGDHMHAHAAACTLYQLDSRPIGRSSSFHLRRIDRDLIRASSARFPIFRPGTKEDVRISGIAEIGPVVAEASLTRTARPAQWFACR